MRETVGELPLIKADLYFLKFISTLGVYMGNKREYR